MKTNWLEFIKENFKMIVTVFSFLIAFYVQSVTNTNSITELKEKAVIVDKYLKEHDEKIHELKIDKATFQSTVEQVSLIRDDIKEMRSDIKELLKQK